jgi:hypothetical protein
MNRTRISKHITAALLVLVSGTASANVVFPKVTNVNDTGNGSLRAAVTAANANGADGAIIDFQIGNACGPHVIHLGTALPDLKFETHFLGFTQPGATKNTQEGYGVNDEMICIVIAGDNLVDDALTVPATVADAMKISVEGIGFSGFTHSAINLRGGSQHLVAGVRTGGTLGGFVMDPVGYGVILAAGVHDAQIGGPDWDGQNQFANIINNAIYVASSSGSTKAAHDNLIYYNNVGYVVEGTTETVQGTGGSGIAVGGKNNALGYLEIQNAGAAGIHISNADATGNYVFLGGVLYSKGDGILIDDDASNNSVGNAGLFDNAGAGVRVVNGQGNELTYNNIDGNGGLGIDLAAVGVTPNDNDSMQPQPDYANRGQNFPVLTSAMGGHTGIVTGTLTTTPGKYFIDLQYNNKCDASGYGQGNNGPEYPKGTTGYITVPNLTVQGQGSVSFSLPVYFIGNTSNMFIVATATDAANNTSEFSLCIPYVDDTVFFSNFE